MSKQESDNQNAADLIQVGSEIVGGLGGLAIGIINGPIAGAASQPIFARAARMAAEFAHRQLSHREKVRVGAVLSLVITQIEEKIARGEQLRQD